MGRIMQDKILKAVELVLQELVQGKDPSEIDESGASMYWDLSKELVHHYKAEVGDEVDNIDTHEFVYYALHDVTEELMKGFINLMQEVGLLTNEGEGVQ